MEFERLRANRLANIAEGPSRPLRTPMSLSSLIGILLAKMVLIQWLYGSWKNCRSNLRSALCSKFKSETFGGPIVVSCQSFGAVRG